VPYQRQNLNATQEKEKGKKLNKDGEKKSRWQHNHHRHHQRHKNHFSSSFQQKLQKEPVFVDSDGVDFKAKKEEEMGSEWVTLMERVRRKPILFLLAVTILLFYVTPLYHHKSPYITFPIICKNASCLQASSAAGIASSLWAVETHPDYLVYSPGCKIMEMDAFDKSVTKFLKKGKPMKCNQRLTNLEDQKIVIDDNFRKSWKTKKTKCCFRSIHRVQQRPDKYDKDADWGIKCKTPLQYPILSQHVTTHSDANHNNALNHKQ